MSTTPTAAPAATPPASAVIQPTIGRRVWFKDRSLSDQFCDAGVAYVHKDGTINLSVSDNKGRAHQRLNVALHQGTPETCPEGQACWMPYQKAQAVK